ncbi:MAG: helix-turn-helix domain-containing protein [Eubacteriaceae bacterium]
MFRETLKQAIERRGDNISTLSKKLGIKSQNLYAYFKCKQSISLNVFESICKEYNLKLKRHEK